MQVINEEIIKIQQRGLFTIPKKMRIKLGLGDNSLIRVQEEKGRIIVEPVRTLPYPVRSYTGAEIKQFVQFDREDTTALKGKGLL